MEDDAVDRFLKSWKGMLLFSVVFFGLFGLLVYGLKLIGFGGEMLGEQPPVYALSNFLFGVWAPWIMASPFAGLGCFFIYAAFHDKASAVPPEKSIREDGQET